MLWTRFSMALGVLVGLSLLGASSAHGQRDQRINSVNSVKPTQSPKSSAQTVVLKTLTVEDTFLKQTAFTVLVPKDWKAEGKILWRLHPIYPATATMLAYNPQGPEAVRFYPSLPFVDGVREAAAATAAIVGPDAVQFVVSQWPEGANYMGSEVRRVVASPAEYLTQILLPRHRPEVKNYKITGSEDMPKWAQSSAFLVEGFPGIQSSAQAARVRIEYTDNGQAIEEDFLILMPRVKMQMLTNWGIESASSVRAEKGKLDGLHKLHQTMLFSTKIDLKWFAKERQVAEILQDMVRRQQKHTMQISQIIAQTNNEVSKIISDSYWDRQKTMDKIHHNFSQYIRGVESYISPHSQYPVELPSGYNAAWVNQYGEYIMSNDLFFDPNQTQNGTWQKLNPKR